MKGEVIPRSLASHSVLSLARLIGATLNQISMAPPFPGATVNLGAKPGDVNIAWFFIWLGSSSTLVPSFKTVVTELPSLHADWFELVRVSPSVGNSQSVRLDMSMDASTALDNPNFSPENPHRTQFAGDHPPATFNLSFLDNHNYRASGSGGHRPSSSQFLLDGIP